ncbi:hypothetical protein Hanom_Chr03g00194671 [Helianthus anomalus]
MAITWATGIRFGHTTRRNERENELQLGLRRFGSSFGPNNAYFHYLFAFLCFLDYFGHFVLGRVFGPLCCLVFETIRLEFFINSFFTSNFVPFGLQFRG